MRDTVASQEIPIECQSTIMEVHGKALTGSHMPTASTIREVLADHATRDPDAAAIDVISLMASVRDLVDLKLGVRLFTEIKLIGFEDTYGLPSGS